MKELKFKIWNKLANKMIPNSFLDAENIMDHIKFKRGVILLEETERALFLQYTGLKDKQGKEIYEGDIVERTDWKNDTLKVVETIEVDLQRFFESKGYGEGEYWEDWSSERLEIIGDIHKNPKLMV